MSDLGFAGRNHQYVDRRLGTGYNAREDFSTRTFDLMVTALRRRVRRRRRAMYLARAPK